MQEMLFVITHSNDDATKAIIPLEMAAVAHKAGHSVQIALLGEGVYLLKKEILENLQGLGTSLARDAMNGVLQADIPIYACGTCMNSRGVSMEDLEGLSARHRTKTSSSNW
jgi:predicted peroxiredoxin